MYAAHFAAALAIKAAEPRAPTGILVVLASAPDLVWLGLSVIGEEVVTPGLWFDGWSHSIASIVMQAILVFMIFYGQGISVATATAAAVLSHLLLDLPMHPAPLQWYPHAASGFGDLLHGRAGQTLALSKTAGWWIEAAVVLCAVSAYVLARRRVGVCASTAAACAILVGSLHLGFG